MRSIHSTVLIAAMVALGSSACSAAPGDASESTSSSQAALSGPILSPPIPPWYLHTTGLEARWVDGSGNPLSSVTITYNTANGASSHPGSMALTMWADEDVIQGQTTENCNYELTAYTAYPLGSRPYAVYTRGTGALLCNGSPSYGTLPTMSVYSVPTNLDMLTAGFELAVGDSLAAVCSATQQRGTTTPVTLLLDVTAWGSVGAGLATPVHTVIANLQPVTVNVTLQCESFVAVDNWGQ